MRKTLLASALAVLLPLAAQAAQVITFGQTSSINTVFATDDGTTTTIVAKAAANISQVIGGAFVGPAFFSLTATSNDVATGLGTLLIQHYDGNFCISTGLGCTGSDILSGVFSDAAFGAKGGPGLAINVNNPPDTLALFTDDLGKLGAPAAFTLAFTNLAPGLHLDGNTIAAFDASFAGDVSATPVAEPASFAMLGMGVLGLGLIRRRST